jgi:hypothetical protein
MPAFYTPNYATAATSQLSADTQQLLARAIERLERVKAACKQRSE